MIWYLYHDDHRNINLKMSYLYEYYAKVLTDNIYYLLLKNIIYFEWP
jgi:hypothetical protein